MCWWKIFQPCVPHCLHSWKYTSTSLNFLFCWKLQFLNCRWSEGRLKPIGWGESISANRQPGKNNVPIDAGVIQFVFVVTSVTMSQTHSGIMKPWDFFLVCNSVYYSGMLYSITFPFFVSGDPVAVSGRWFQRLSDGRCAFFMAPKDGPSCAASGGGGVPRCTHV